MGLGVGLQESCPMLEKHDYNGASVASVETHAPEASLRCRRMLLTKL